MTNATLGHASLNGTCRLGESVGAIMSTKLKVSLLAATGIALIACGAESTDPDAHESSFSPRYSAELEPNNRIEEAIVLERNHALAAICPGGDEDYYAFDLKPDRDVMLYISFDSPQSQRDLDLRLYSDTGALIDESATLDDFELIQRTAVFSNRLSEGRYVFAVSGRERDTQNDYAFVLTIE